MALSLSDKKNIVLKINKLASESVCVIAANYKRANVLQMTNLRKESLGSEVTVCAYRNSLSILGLQKTQFACLSEILSGPTILFFSKLEMSSAAKILDQFVKKHDVIQITGIVADNKLFQPERLEFFAKLPSKKEAITQLSFMINTPITRLVCAIKEPVSRLIRSISSLKK